MDKMIQINTAFGQKLYKLPAVKESLYHPNLPTFRRMDIDTAAHKLPDEHCRTTSAHQSNDFRNATISLYRPSKKPLACMKVTETGKKYLDSSSTKDVDGGTAEKSGNAERLSFSGYSMRYLSPLVTASWKYSLRQEPCLDKFGQRPIPANIYSRHRTSTPGYGSGVFAWKP